MPRAAGDNRPNVLRVIQRTRDLLAAEGHPGPLGPNESVFSKNAVAGPTIEVPIAGTCQPTKLCARDCYAAYGPQAVPANLRRQHRVLASIEADPLGFAARLAGEYDRLGHGYVRWNGLGDLTPPAVDAVNWLALRRPDVTLWVVTRRPELAARVADAPRVFVHVSLDGTSLDRKAAFLAARPRSRNYFFSYEAARDERPARGGGVGASVVFHKGYRPPPGADLGDPALRPLNTLDDCTGACARCRRCFDGTAVAMRRAAEEVHDV